MIKRRLYCKKLIWFTANLYHNSITPSVCVCVYVYHTAYSSKPKDLRTCINIFGDPRSKVKVTTEVKVKMKKINMREIWWNAQKIENYNFKIFIQIRKNLEILWWATFHTRLYEERLLSVDTVLDFCNMCFGMAMKWITRDQLMNLMVLTTEIFYYLYYCIIA